MRSSLEAVVQWQIYWSHFSEAVAQWRSYCLHSSVSRGCKQHGGSESARAEDMGAARARVQVQGTAWWGAGERSVFQPRSALFQQGVGEHIREVLEQALHTHRWGLAAYHTGALQCACMCVPDAFCWVELVAFSMHICSPNIYAAAAAEYAAEHTQTFWGHVLEGLGIAFMLLGLHGCGPALAFSSPKRICLMASKPCLIKPCLIETGLLCDRC